MRSFKQLQNLSIVTSEGSETTINTLYSFLCIQCTVSTAVVSGYIRMYLIAEVGG